MSLEGKLQELIDAFGGGNQSAFAKLCSIDEASIRQWLKGTSKPTWAKIQAIGEACNVSLDWLVLDRGSKIYSGSELDEADAIRVPVVEAEASAGSGGFGAGDIALMEPEYLSMSVRLLQDIGVRPKYAQFIRVRGDSMEPTIRSGELVLVDREIDRIVDNGIYVITWSGAVFIKRAQLTFDGTLVLKSDNGYYDDERIPHDEMDHVKVEGRVKWIGKTA